jgi:hypothetical protein
MVFLDQLHDRIIHDPEWQEWAKMVGQYNADTEIKFGCDHSKPHWLRVAAVAEDFVRRAGGNHYEMLLADIAGLIHDCGLICGDANHATNGARIAEAYLKSRWGNGRPLKDSDIAIIVHAIAHHSSCDDIQNLVDAALIFADKTDLDHRRALQTVNHTQQEITKIKQIQFKITKTTLALNYEVADDFNLDNFHWKKAFDAPAAVAVFLSKEFRFYVNGRPVRLSTSQTPTV